MNIDDRISSLESDMSAVKADVAVVRLNYATKEDLQKAINALTWKIYGVMTALAAVVFFIARNIR
ncbi:hypothetical protein [Massilia cavernae]|uniref:Hemolysin XhlA n=1 Tax=Massilia cavernae TaxID=2320864 RepID=A0A418Y4U0_9BURK|nr:hypothetical protein [Massilia cavernae]RJG21076.1 hypothetical protein D3872_07330 [Massilia cavernae]